MEDNYNFISNSIKVFTCDKEEIKSMFKLGNLDIYLPISANFLTRLGFKLFFGIKLITKKGEKDYE